jgi:pyruvate/2-oxoglutarate/acetoin dehydrogenase E1 component
VLVIEHQALYATDGPVPDDRDFCIPFGKARLAKPGAQLTIASYSNMARLALEAARGLEAEGISAEVLDLRSLDYAGIDYAAIGESLKKTGRLLIAEEGLLPGGVGAQIADEVQRRFFDWLDAEIVRVGGAALPMPVSRALERMAVPGAAEIARAARDMLK